MASDAGKKKKAPVKKPVAKKVAAPKAKKVAPKAPSKVSMEVPVVKKIRAATKPKSKTGSYTQSEFLENLRAFCGFTKKTQAKEVSEDITILVLDCLKKGYKIPLFSLGKMHVRKTKPRNGINPTTKEPIKIPAKKKVRFSPAKSLKEAVL
jgi:DNA-binding protein HU-beta